MKRIEHRQEALAGHGEQPVAALLDQAIDEQTGGLGRIVHWAQPSDIGTGADRREAKCKRTVKPFAMRRFLVLTDETARHPFRASLPPHVVRDAAPIPVARSNPMLTASEWRLLATTYAGALVAVSLFLM